MRKIVLVGCAVLAGCSAQPAPYHSGNEIPQGPGLLSGAEGAFVLRTGEDKPRESAAPQNADEEREYREWREQKRQQENTKK
jgi:hypothetical protein